MTSLRCYNVKGVGVACMVNRGDEKEQTEGHPILKRFHLAVSFLPPMHATTLHGINAIPSYSEVADNRSNMRLLPISVTVYAQPAAVFASDASWRTDRETFITPFVVPVGGAIAIVVVCGLFHRAQFGAYLRNQTLDTDTEPFRD